ncbi:TniQ family protein [Kitasatospora sp. NPDC059795]|uniref:TniQ family protein n=1 Tax=Kitasatospora sp. NPDC059795 TaxID=3346949 RepID=UPI00364D860D
MTASHDSAAPARARRLGPADLPLTVPLIDGETVFSFTARTAAANGFDAARLLKALRVGRTVVPAGLRPQETDLRLTSAALERLAHLVGRTIDELRQVLPAVRPDRLLDGEDARIAIGSWPRVPGRTPLPACPLCMEDSAWLEADGRRWTPCPCGRRWMAGDDGGYLVDTTALPELGRALRDHRALFDRLGYAGDALVADAHQVALWWWVNRQVAHRQWREREDALGLARHRRRAAPVVVYPEAVRLAEAMDRWEQQRAGRRADPQAWLALVGRRLDAPAISGGGREAEPLWHWLALHPFPASGSERWAQLPELHHHPRHRAVFAANSCLRWTYGRPLTTVEELCPYCGGDAATCLWAPADDCPARLGVDGAGR